MASPTPHPPRLPAVLEPREHPGLHDDAQWVGLEIPADLSNGEALHLEIAECRLTSTNLISAVLSGAHLSDTELLTCELSGAMLEEGTFTRVAFRGCRMRGVVLSLARLRDVSFVDCLLDGALAGAIVDADQVVPLALQLFGASGITVEDQRHAEEDAR